jgi:hypothetical protein
MLIQLPDPVALRYQHAAIAAHVPLEKFLERQLEKFAAVPSGQRTVILSGDALERIDTLLGIGSTASPAALLTAIESWAGITIGGIRLDFSPAQLAEIAHRAEKQGKPPEEIVADIVAQMEDQFFYGPVVAR